MSLLILRIYIKQVLSCGYASCLSWTEKVKAVDYWIAVSWCFTHSRYFDIQKYRINSRGNYFNTWRCCCCTCIGSLNLFLEERSFFFDETLQFGSPCVTSVVANTLSVCTFQSAESCKSNCCISTFCYNSRHWFDYLFRVFFYQWYLHSLVNILFSEVALCVLLWKFWIKWNESSRSLIKLLFK